MIDIKDISGSTRFSTPINEGSKRKFLLMKEDYISLKFSLDKPVYFKLGDYVDDPRFGLFELCDLQKPTFNNSNGGYEYDLRLDAYYWKWKNKIFKFTPETGGQEASWSLTASLDIQLGVFLRNLQALGYTYKGTNFEFSIDSTVENKSLPMTYDHANLLDSLTRIAEAWGCEWWITESVIHLGRCEHSDPVNFESGKNVETMTRSDSQTNFATRVYAFGSTRNIPTNYRPVDESIVVNGITQKRLMLPVGAPYIDAYPNMSTEEAVEDVVVFDDVYPRRTGTVSDITIHEYTDIIKEEGKPDVVKKWNAYRFKDSGITFSNDYRLAGQELKIIFQSGALNGMEFVVIFNPCDKEGGETVIPEKNEDGSWNPLAQVWEIVRNEDYGRPLPGDSLIPKDGDTYILSGFDTKFVSDGMIPEAEQELKEKALKYLEKSKVDPSTYENKMMSDHMVNEDGTLKLFEAGDRVNLLNSAYFETGNRISRIIGFEYNLDIPYDSPVYTVGETASYSRLGEIESKVETLDYKGQTYTGNGGGGVYVIRRNDSTPASDSNVFSALRSMAEFINKTRPDVAQEVITFLKGVRFGNYTDKSGGIISVDSDGKTYAEVDRLKVRLKAYFETLEIQNVNSVGGKTVMTPAGSIKCIKVSDRDIITNNDGTTDETIWAYYRCYFLSDQEGVKVENRFKVGDLAYSQNFNIKTGTHEGLSNHYYWREVIAVGEDYIDLSKTKSDAGSDSPQAGDVICQLGNTSDKDRQNAIIISSVDLFSPSISLYQGIDNYSFLDKDFISYGVDATTKKAYFNVYGNMYVGDREKTTYFRYDQENGVEIKGRLVTRSGKDVEDNLSSMQDQLDGVKETFYGDHTPTLSNYPANEWVTDNVKQRHELDVFTNIQAYINDETTPDAGKSWRWITNNGAWEWTQISDSDTSKAFLEAAKAMQAAKEAQLSAIQANNAVIGLKDFTDTAFADGIISRSEAIAIESYINNILSIRNGVTESYNKIYSNPLLDGVDKVNLKTGFDGFILSTSELINTINAAVSDGTTTIVEKAAVDDKYDVFNTKYGDFTAYINAANKYIQDKINQSATNALDKVIELDYLKTALSGSTIVDGGLVLTSLVGTGYQHATDGFKLMSGISGIYDKSKQGGGAASWYGGAMKDLFDYPKGSAPSDVAKGLIRMDGTGYFAGGNLWWEKDGTLHADPLSFFVGENSIGFASALFKFIPKTGTIGDKWGDIDYVIPQKPFQKLTVASYIELGNGFKFKVDELNNSVCIEKENGDPVNFRVTGGITQYATGSSIASTIMDAIITDEVTITKAGGKLSVIGEPGGGGISSLVVKLGSSIYNGIGTKDVVVSLPAYPTTLPASDVPAWAKAASKPGYSWNEIGSKPTTLGGYGITDALGINSNAVSASKLQTPRSIWGQSFDGTGNVDGHLTANGNIKTINNDFIVNKNGKEWRVGQGAYTGGNDLIIGGDSTNNIRLTASAQLGIKCSPIITLALGDSDTGFNWVSDGDYRFVANGQTAAGITSSGFYAYKTLYSAVTGGTAPISVSTTSVCPNLNADLLDGFHGNQYLRTDGTNQYVTLTGGNNNVEGWRLVLETQALGGWNINSMTLLVNSRHSGTGILSIVFHTTNSDGTAYVGKLAYHGSNTSLDSYSWRAFYNTTTKKFRLFWHYYDYSNTVVSVLNRSGFLPLPSNGTWYETLPSDNGNEILTYYNAASYLEQTCSIWGQSFNGQQNISGRFELNGSASSNFSIYDDGGINLQSYGGRLLSINKAGNNIIFGNVANLAKFNYGGTSFYNVNGDATLAMYAGLGLSGNETICLQTTFDGQDPVSSSYPSGYPQRAILALQPRGGRVALGKTTASYPLDVIGSILCSDWIRTSGKVGWYNETYSGGIYMEDSTYVRVWNNKRFYSSGGFEINYEGSSWISMATRTNCIIANQNNSSVSAHALFRTKFNNGVAIVYGGLGNDMGFFGFSATNIANNVNEVSWKTLWDSNGNFYNQKKIGSSDTMYAHGQAYTLTWNTIFNPENSTYGDREVNLVSHNQYKPMIGWHDQISGQGFITKYNIGSYRTNYKWGQMVLAVSNNDYGNSSGAAVNISGDGTVTIEGNLLVTGGITQYSNGVSTTDTFSANTLKANNCLLIGTNTVLDANTRYINCMGKTGYSYISFGYSNSQGNSGELAWNYVGNNSGDNMFKICAYGYSFADFYVSGNHVIHNNLRVTGSFSYTSDVRKKNIVRFIDYLSIDQIANAPIFDFTWKDSKDLSLNSGTSAQYWKEIFPNSVKTWGDSYSIDGSTSLVCNIVIARELQKLKRENEELRQEINQLKERAS